MGTASFSETGLAVYLVWYGIDGPASTPTRPLCVLGYRLLDHQTHINCS